MSRIVYVWDSEYPWDIRAEKVCSALQKAGHEVHLVARNSGWRATEEVLPECTVHRMRPWRWIGQKLDRLLGFPAFFNPRWINLVSKTVSKVHADIIISRDLPLCPTALFVGKRFGIPVIGDFAENYPAMMRAIWESKQERYIDYIVRNPIVVSLVERYCLPRLARIVVVVEEAAERFVRLGVSRKRIDVVSNTPPIQHAVFSIPPENVRHKEPIKAVYLGLLEVPRGIDDILEAAVILRNIKRIRIRIRLIGEGRDRTLFETRAADLGLKPTEVEFTGHVPYKQALQMIAESDVGLVPHVRCEAWDTTIPNKLFDYMAAGKPVVSSNTVPCVRVLQETKAGEIYESGNASSLANTLIRMLDPRIRSARGKAGRRAIMQQYHWERDATILQRSVELAVRV